MIGYAGAPRAYWMAHGMARTAGVPLARAVVEGSLSRQDLAQIVDRCHCCPRTDDCTHWLASPRAENPPQFCAIKPDRDALATLR